jgi:radical SAM-linked protein
MPLDKHRIRFSKSGNLRLVSHLDLLRSMERLLRRSGLPFRMSEGFHPSPRLMVAQSLPLGVVGLAEVAELELTEEVEPDEVLRRLQSQSPPGLGFHSVRRIALKTTARPWRASYRVPHSLSPDELGAKREQLLAAAEVWAVRERPKPREINIRPYVDSLTVNEVDVHMSLWLTQEGSARADEVAAALGITDWPQIERTGLELLDEVPAELANGAPKIEPQTRPLNRTVPVEPRPAAPRETWGATSNGPIVE